MQTLLKVEAIQCISAQTYCSLMLGYQKRKMAEKPQKKTAKTAKNCAKKHWLNKVNNIFPWLGRVSKTVRMLSENGRPEMFSINGRFSAKTGRLESSQFILRWLL